jgi:hypothetical protein
MLNAHLATSAFALMPCKPFTRANQENKKRAFALYFHKLSYHIEFLFNLGCQLWGKLTNKKGLAEMQGFN